MSSKNTLVRIGALTLLAGLTLTGCDDPRSVRRRLATTPRFADGRVKALWAGQSNPSMIRRPGSSTLRSTLIEGSLNSRELGHAPSRQRGRYLSNSILLTPWHSRLIDTSV